jgi:hypothetical protein
LRDGIAVVVEGVAEGDLVPVSAAFGSALFFAGAAPRALLLLGPIGVGWRASQPVQ